MTLHPQRVKAAKVIAARIKTSKPLKLKSEGRITNERQDMNLVDTSNINVMTSGSC